MDQRMSGPALVTYLRDSPTSEVSRWAAAEIEHLRAALATIAEWPTPAKTPVSVELRNVQLVAWSALQGVSHGQTTNN